MNIKFACLVDMQQFQGKIASVVSQAQYAECTCDVIPKIGCEIFRKRTFTPINLDFCP